MVTDEGRPPEAVPAIPGHPLDRPLTVREAVRAGIGLADGVPGALTDVRDAIPWAAPEVLDGRSRGSVASDVYSLGAVLWHLLVRPPAVLGRGRRQLTACTHRADPALGPAPHAARRRTT